MNIKKIINRLPFMNNVYAGSYRLVTLQKLLFFFFFYGTRTLKHMTNVHYACP